MTQREVAEIAGVTPAFLSQLESDKAVAAAATLRRILAAMHVNSLGDFFLAVERGENRIHRAEDRVMMIGPDEPIKMEYVGPRNRNLSFCLFYAEMQPGYASEDTDADAFDQCIIVLEGKLGIDLDGEVHEVDAGEACFIEAYCSHRAWNLSDGLTRIYSVNSTYSQEQSGRPLQIAPKNTKAPSATKHEQ
jgi:transcriptional regulator with XRE-family HTH domain